MAGYDINRMMDLDWCVNIHACVMWIKIMQKYNKGSFGGKTPLIRLKRSDVPNLKNNSFYNTLDWLQKEDMITVERVGVGPGSHYRIWLTDKSEGMIRKKTKNKEEWQQQASTT